jgi:MoaA/NifB/PqqE/SkfB family radical SAM enzyme
MVQNGWRVAHVVMTRQLGLAPRYLPVLLMFITDKCNLRCKMCGVCDLERGRGTEKELSTEEWFAVIDAAERLGTALVSISGGEPMLRADLYDLIRHARGKGMTVHMCTNGTLMNADRAHKLRDSGVSTVSISVDSPRAEMHEKLRGRDTFGPALAAVKLLRETAPEIRVGINYLITRQNYRNMGEMVAFAESLGVHQIKFAPIHTNLLHRLKDIGQYDDLLFTPEDLPELDRQVRQLSNACARSSLLTTSSAFFAGIADLYSAPRHFSCHAGWAAVAVGPTGSVTPCADMDGSLSVRRRPLDEIWKSPEFHEQRKRVQTCDHACWDTTNTELSLRLRPASLVGGFLQNLRDIKFYFGGKR